MQGDRVGDDDVDLGRAADIELFVELHRQCRGSAHPRGPAYGLQVVGAESLGGQPDVGPDVLSHRLLQPGPNGRGHRDREGDDGHPDHHGQRRGEAQSGTAHRSRGAHEGHRPTPGAKPAVQQQERHRIDAEHDDADRDGEEDRGADHQRVDADSLARLDQATAGEHQERHGRQRDGAHLEHPANPAPVAQCQVRPRLSNAARAGHHREQEGHEHGGEEGQDNAGRPDVGGQGHRHGAERQHATLEQR